MPPIEPSESPQVRIAREYLGRPYSHPTDESIDDGDEMDIDEFDPFGSELDDNADDGDSGDDDDDDESDPDQPACLFCSLLVVVVARRLGVQVGALDRSPDPPTARRMALQLGTALAPAAGRLVFFSPVAGDPEEWHVGICISGSEMISACPERSAPAHERHGVCIEPIGEHPSEWKYEGCADFPDAPG